MSTIDEMRRRSDLPVVVADHQGFVTHVNEQFEKTFGWKKDEIIGKALTTIIPKNLHDSHHLGFSRFLTTGKPTLMNQPLNLKAIAKDGREFDSEHIIVAEQQGGQWVFAATIRPLP